MNANVSDAFGYDPRASMGHPRMVSMADAAADANGRTIAYAVEQVAYELRTANLIQYLRDNGGMDPAYGLIMTEIRQRLALAPLDTDEAF